MTSMTASALRPWRSKWMRWRSPLPLLVGPGTVETQLGSHSGMRLASEMRSNTSWMVTPTVPVYVSETGRMEIIWRQRAARDRRADAPPCRPLPPLPPIAAPRVGEPVLVLQGLSRRAAESKFPVPPGAVAQLGERLDRTQEVRGSSPLSSTVSCFLSPGWCRARGTRSAVRGCVRRDAVPRGGWFSIGGNGAQLTAHLTPPLLHARGPAR